MTDNSQKTTTPSSTPKSGETPQHQQGQQPRNPGKPDDGSADYSQQQQGDGQPQRKRDDGKDDKANRQMGA